MNKKKAADRACFQLLFVSINIELSVATASFVLPQPVWY